MSDSKDMVYPVELAFARYHGVPRLLAAFCLLQHTRHTSRTADSSSILVWRSSKMRWSIMVSLQVLSILLLNIFYHNMYDDGTRDLLSIHSLHLV